MVDYPLRYRKDPSMVARRIVNETVLVPIRKNAADLESIYALNDTAAFAWDLLDGQHTLAEISARIAEEFEVIEDQAQLDLTELIDQLQKIGAVQRI